MPLIPEDLIDEIQERVDIAEVIGRYAPLKRAGRHFKALCPFHHEKTPSFMVNTQKQIFHCFGCGTGGNVFSFLMQHDRMTFPEAVRQLGAQVGLPVPERAMASEDGTHERLAALMEKICRYFERLLAHPQQGSAAREYLKRRGVSDRARQRFRLGFTPPGWDQLLTAATMKGVSREDLEAAGLIVKGRSTYYDRFRNRLVFPILDVRGRVVGFGGRSLDDQEPKYLNSPETRLYTKGRHLFGLAQAKEAILEQKAAVVVEGYFDCVVLSDAGIAHVVSPLGTALTTDQARLLKRYAERVILAFDPDAAGETATLRGIDLLVEVGLTVDIAQLPAGVDPDECLRLQGRQRFEELLSQSTSIIEFLIRSALRRYPGRETERRVEAAQFVLPTLARIPNAMLRSEYVRLLADRLHLDEAAVTEELAKVQPRTSMQASVQRMRHATSAKRAPAHGPERLLTALVLDEPARWAKVTAQCSLEEIADPALRRILGVVAELVEMGSAATPAQVVSRLSEEGQSGLVTELVELAQSVPSKEEAFADCLRRVQDYARRRHLEDLRGQLQSAQESGRERDLQRLLVEYQQLVKA